MGAAASSSSSSALSSSKYDVFISFRGEDTRTNFTSHLHQALCQKSIRAYIDYELPKGDEISQALIQAIEDSSISVVVFSGDYASSKWCLNELIKISQCKKDQGQVVIPVFYKVDPSHVRNQLGTYKDAFAKHERDFMHDLNKVNNWRRALLETANLAGWDSQNYRDESEFIQNIVENILQKMNSRCPSALNGLVGINENCDNIELLLEKASIVGIWGMGGIGKTTIAKVVFAKLSSKFESCCFLENFREESEKHGLAYIRDKLLVELLREENLYNSKSVVVGSGFALRRLGNKKVFIVLDDVNSSKQLEYLAKDCNCLGQGSKVIITTRNKHLLTGRVNEIYEAKPLSYYKSIQLFNLKAFHTDHPKVGYEQLSERAVDYAKGIPLALIVLGSFLFSKTTKEWDSALAKLKKTLHGDIQEVLQLSFNGLNDEEKDIFLDIAFFLKGEDEQYVIALLDNCGFHASIGLRTLKDNALITINDAVVMHDLIQEMAYEIVRQQCIKEPGRRSRLCDPKEVYSVLKNNMGTNAIEGILLDLSQIRDIHLNADTFKKMNNLRFLKFYSSRQKRSCNVNLPFGLESLSDKLKYLRWDRYPLESLPSTFCPEKLVELCLKNSHVKKLWDGAQDLVNLRRINLGGCKQLIELPDFSEAQNLERMNLSSCESLCHVHSSILSLQKLVSLNLHKCIKLKDLQSESHLKSLRNLHVSWCFSLTEFSLSSEAIENLELKTTGIQLLDSSIGRLNKLKMLSLNGSRLKNLPINELCCLTSLQELHLSNCAQVIDELKLHTLFDALQSLRKLYLDGCCNLTELPNNIKHLSRLQVLSLRSCKRLQSLPELPLLIEELDATNCTSLETLNTPQMEESSIIGSLRNLRKLRICVSRLENFSIDQLCCLRSLKELTLSGCRKMVDKSKLHMLFGALHSFIDLFLEGCSNLCEVPDNISNLSSLYLLGLEGSSVESLPTSIKHLSKLDYIYLTNCRRLRSLPELPPFTQYVKATNCTSLETIFPFATSSPGRKYLVESLFLENCLELKDHSLSHIEEYSYFSLKRAVYINRIGAVCYPGSKFPQWLGDYQTVASSSMTIKLSSAVNNLLGFVFCCVLPQFTSEQNYRSYLKCQCFFGDGDEVKAGDVDDMRITDLNGDHVFLWYDPIYSTFILRELIEREDEQGTTYKPELSFEFSVVTYSENYEITKQHDLIKACGVCPIYASEYHNFLQKMELELKLGMKSKRGWEIDEPSLCGIMEYATFSLERPIYVNSEKSIISYPKTTIPKWFTYKKSKKRDPIFVGFAPNFDNLLGFVFCFVIPQFSKEKDQSHSGCRCRYGDGQRFSMEGPRGWHYSMTALNSDSVFLWYDPLFCEFILEKFRRDRGNNNDEGTSYNNRPILTFEFEFGNGLIEECGVRPIYASEYDKFLQQKEVKVEVGAKTKRRRDTEDEEEQFPLAKKFKEACIVHPVPQRFMASQNIDDLQLTLSQLKLESSKDST